MQPIIAWVASGSRQGRQRWRIAWLVALVTTACQHPHLRTITPAADSTLHTTGASPCPAPAADNSNKPSILVVRDKDVPPSPADDVFPADDSTITKQGVVYVCENARVVRGNPDNAALLKNLRLELAGTILFDGECSARCNFRSNNSFTVRMEDIDGFDHWQLLTVEASNVSSLKTDTYYHTHQPRGWAHGIGAPVLYRLTGTPQFFDFQSLAPSISATYHFNKSRKRTFVGLGPIVSVFPKKETDGSGYSLALGSVVDANGMLQAGWLYHLGEKRGFLVIGLRPEIVQRLLSLKSDAPQKQ